VIVLEVTEIIAEMLFTYAYTARIAASQESSEVQALGSRGFLFEAGTQDALSGEPVAL